MNTLQVEAVRLLVLLAWSDGSMALEEEQAIQCLITGSKSLGEQERAEALRLLHAEEATGDTGAHIHSIASALRLCPEVTRQLLYQTAVLLCRLGDGDLSTTEQQHLAALRSGLNLGVGQSSAGS